MGAAPCPAVERRLLLVLLDHDHPLDSHPLLYGAIHMRYICLFDSFPHSTTPDLALVLFMTKELGYFFFFLAVQQPMLFPGRVSQLRRVPWPTATGTTPYACFP